MGGPRIHRSRSGRQDWRHLLTYLRPQPESALVFLDSALSEDARWAADQGFVSGITTNPRLMAATGQEPLTQLAALLDLFPATVCYQVTTTDPEAAAIEAQSAWNLNRERVVVKIPALPTLLPLVVDLQRTGVVCMVTGVISPTQVLALVATGASWMAAYVDRARRLGGDVGQLIEQARAVVDRAEAPTRILAAGLVDADQAVAAVVAGADTVTLPRPILQELSAHEVTATVTAAMLTALDLR